MLRLIFKYAGLLLLGTLPLLGQAAPGKASAKVTHRKHKPSAVKAVQVPPVPVAVAPMTPEMLPPAPPRVSFQNGTLAIDSQNSTLGDILNAIRRQTGAQIEAPPVGSNERVAAHLSGPPREVITSLLEGSNLGYIIMAAPDNPDRVQRIVLTSLAPSAPGNAPPANAAMNQPNPGAPQQAFNPGAPQQPFNPDVAPDEAEEPPPDAVNDRNPGTPEQNAQPQPPPGPGGEAAQNPYTGGEQPRYGQQPGMAPQQIPAQGQPQDQTQPQQQQIKTPDQLLQELQRLRNQQNQQQNPQQNPQRP